MISVVMPAYNAEDMLERALLSVMRQSHTALELLIIDDASTDATADVARRYAQLDKRVKLIVNDVNEGAARSRNKGVAESRGEYVAFLDSDDTWRPDKLERQLCRMGETGAQICYTSYAIVDTQGKKVRADYIVPHETEFSSMLRENVIGCSTVLLTAQAAKAHTFEEEYYHEDYVLWLRLLGEGRRAAGCTEVLTNWCYREDSRSYDKLRSMRERWRIYRRALGMPLPRSIGCILQRSFGGRDGKARHGKGVQRARARARLQRGDGRGYPLQDSEETRGRPARMLGGGR